MRILKMYEQGSGQMINLDNSSMIFSKNMEQEKQKEICRRLGNIQVVKQGKYLGLPMVITRTKEQMFGFIKENCQRTMNSRRNKILNRVGKEILMKAITVVMPMYATSCFKLPVKLCRDINAIMANSSGGKRMEKEKFNSAPRKN